MKCTQTRFLPRHQKHDERVVRRERTEHGIAYHCACRCGETWIIGVMVAPEVADQLAAL